MKLISWTTLCHQEKEEPIKNILQITVNWESENKNRIKEATYIKRPRNTTRELYRHPVPNDDISVYEKIKTLS